MMSVAVPLHPSNADTGGIPCRPADEQLLALATELFARLKHLHGLTKTSLRMLKAVALGWSLRDMSREARNEALLGRVTAQKVRLNRRQMGIVGAALDLDLSAVRPAADASPAPGTKKDALAGIALRLGALVQLAAGLQELGDPGVGHVQVFDDGAAIELAITGSTSAERIMAAGGRCTTLWNSFALRPVRGIGAAEAGDSGGGSAFRLRSGEPRGEAACRVLQRLLEQLISRQYGLAYTEDVEYVHEMRVAIRRLRAAIRLFRKTFVGGLEAERDELRKLADALGGARDSDVFLGFVAEYARKGPAGHERFVEGLVRDEKRQRRAQARQVLKLCRSPEHQAFIGQLYERLRGPAGVDGGVALRIKSAAKPVATMAGKALGRTLDKVLAFGPRLRALSDTRQHDLRITCKKLRYTAEFLGDLYPGGLKDLVTATTNLQDHLGRSHDADVYQQRATTFFQKRFPKPTRKTRLSLAALEEYLRRRKRKDLAKAAAAWRAFVAPQPVRNLRKLLQAPAAG